MTDQEVAVAQLRVLVRRVVRALRAGDQRELTFRWSRMAAWGRAHQGQDLTDIVAQVLPHARLWQERAQHLMMIYPQSEQLDLVAAQAHYRQVQR